MGGVDKNIEYYTQIAYPEYSNKASSTKDLSVKPNGSKDFGLLDLSLSQKDRIDKKIIQIVSNDLLNIGKYSHTQNDKLINLLSKSNHVPKKNILITAGCDGALKIISQLLISRNINVCIPVPSFGRYEYHTKINKGKIHFFYNKEFPYDTRIKELLEFLNKNKIEVLFLANPNNPTGIYKPQHEIITLLDNFKGYSIIDESLINPNTISTAQLIKKYPKLIVAKSFSKFYGLAGARIGYIVASEKLIKPLLNLVSPFEVNSLALSLAIAVLKDKELADMEAKIIKAEIKKLLRTFRKNTRINITPSESSLALIQYSGKEPLFDLLLKRGIKTVNGNDFRGLENTNTVRISIKDSDSMNYLISEIDKI
jgi:histidinol-phosphate aminotransferase